MTQPILIAGAGLCGLSCAKHLGGGYRLIERSDAVGGAARSFMRDGFSFDVTGHWLHLRDEGITALVEGLIGDELVTVERRAAIYSHGVTTPYPFQANTYGLPAEVVSDCVLGYFRAREAEARGEQRDPQSFEDYIRQRMGDGIAEHFMIPYNTKLWTVPPAQMSHEWCGRFVPIPSPEEVVRGALEPAGAGHRLGYNATFRYPRQGGIQRLATTLHASLPEAAELGLGLQAVDWRARSVELSDGSPAGYEVLVSTLPLADLAAVLVDPPEAVAAAASQLRATSVTYWDMGLARANHPDDPHWIYFPEPDVPFYRVGSASAAVESLAPAGHRSHYIEVAHPRKTPCPATEDDILAGLRKVGLLGAEEQPTVMHRSTVDCGYVIMDMNYGAARSTLLEWLESQHILSVGRWGSWTYDSMEGAMVQGRDAATRAQALRKDG